MFGLLVALFALSLLFRGQVAEDFSLLLGAAVVLLGFRKLADFWEARSLQRLAASNDGHGSGREENTHVLV